VARYFRWVQEIEDTARPVHLLSRLRKPRAVVARLVSPLTTETVRRSIEDDRNRARRSAWERKREALSRAGVTA
jgi:hypothetical protein